MTESYTAVLDRFEESTAVLLLEQDGEQVDELLVERAGFPRDGRHQDAVFELLISDTEVSIRYREAGTEQLQKDARVRFAQLSKELPDGSSDDE